MTYQRHVVSYVLPEQRALASQHSLYNVDQPTLVGQGNRGVPTSFRESLRDHQLGHIDLVLQKVGDDLLCVAIRVPLVIAKTSE